ncbi:MAG: signal peptide peptidase SppA [Candidatus Latescibacterota bacterium]
MINRNDMVLGLIAAGALLTVALFSLISMRGTGGEGVRVTRKSIAVIEITGLITSAEPVVEDLERYIRNDRIPAVVIRLDTPGGAVAPSQEIYSAVLKARQKGKIIIASMGTVAASGGYYIAAACDTVMANPGTITGSIGVIADFAQISELLNKIGVDVTVIKSGKFKDTGSMTREMTEEEKELIQGVLMDTYDQFVEAVAHGRGMDLEKVLTYADGRVFTGRQAKELGFVDMLGTYRDAINMAGRMTGIGENPPVVKEDKDRFWDMVLRGSTNILARVLDLSIPRVSYRMH